MSEQKKAPFIDQINSILSTIDGIFDVLGIWRDIIFKYLIPSIAIYFPVQYFIIGELTTRDPYFSQALIYLIDIFAIALLCGLVYFQHTFASAVEVILCLCFILDGGLHILDLSSVMYINGMFIGLLSSMFLILMKFSSGIYLLLKSYRRKHMKKKHRRTKKRTAIMLEEEKWVLRRNQRPKSQGNPLDQEDFVLDTNIKNDND